MMFYSRLLALTVLTLNACATTSPIVEAETAEKELASVQDEQRRQEMELHAFTTESPPCERACPVPENVCTSAARICEIARNREGVDRVQEACSDATDRCDRVRGAVRVHCNCATVRSQTNPQTALSVR